MAKRTTTKGAERAVSPTPARPAAEANAPRSGAEAVPPKAMEQHSTEHESGYGGKKSEPRVSADQHDK